MARSPLTVTADAGVARLDALLTQAALSSPQRTAIIFGETTWTYGEVHERARRLAGGLSALGVQHGDRVALWSSNRAEFVEVLFGVPMLGAIAAPLDHWWTFKDAQVALEQISPKVLIVDAAKRAAIASVHDMIEAAGIEHVLCLDQVDAGDTCTSYPQLLHGAAPPSILPAVGATDPALILFTSGSTGRSKGAVHSHGGLVATAATMSSELQLSETERTLHFLPMFSSCLEQLIPLVYARGTHVILAQFDASAAWEAVRSFEITHFDAVPTTLRRMLEVLPAKIPQSLRLISYASERMPDALITALIERLPGVAFVQFYGMIEHLCITVLDAADQLRKMGTVGRPMLGAELYLLNEAGEIPSPHESGEIVARSPTLFSGYWQDASATEQVMRGGWMRTGDFGRIDSEGFLWLEGRVKEMIKSGGLTVIPSEIENVLLGHPGVRDAVVAGVPDERWGEAVHAFVTPSPGASLSETELRAFCKERLAGYKCPKSIQVVPELPKTGIGKIARRLVREQVSASLLGDKTI
jgi:acyl-CoA synthetase (AMP-forming)/AMP-acid ligase II